MKSTAGLYSIIIGSCVIILWCFLLISENVPELITDPYGIITHIVAEFLMGLLLIISGILLLSNWKRSYYLYFFSNGLLTYSVINSSGYYMKNQEYAFVIIFFTILIINIVINIAIALKKL